MTMLTSGAHNWSKMMVCLKNSPHYALSLAKIAASRLMSTIAFKCGVSRVKWSIAIPARKNTTLSAKPVQNRSGQGVIAQKSVQIVAQQQPAKPAGTSLKRRATSIVITALRLAATVIKQSCTLAATIWQRWRGMSLSVASVGQSNHPMFITLTCLGGSKRLIKKGATTT